MLPDFGTFYAQNIGTKPIHLFVPGASPTVMQSDNKLWAINFAVECDGQRMMGTIECDSRVDAMIVAKELVSTGVYCQARPDLAYTGVDGWQQVVPFRLYSEPKPLSPEASQRIEAAEAKRAKKAAKRQALVSLSNTARGK